MFKPQEAAQDMAGGPGRELKEVWDGERETERQTRYVRML